MKLAKILSVFVVIAAAGMVPAGCESPSGGAITAIMRQRLRRRPVLFLSACEEQSSSTSAKKQSKLNLIDMRNGGMGLWKSFGIVSTQTDSYLVYDWDLFANDFTITVPAVMSI